MMSKSKILSCLNCNEPKDELTYSINTQEPESLKKSFITALELAGGEFIESKDESLESTLEELTCKNVASSYNYKTATINPNTIDNKLDLSKLDYAIVEAKFGVAENGAVWINEEGNINRAIYTIVNHLIVVLKGEIVPTMLEAYELIEDEDFNYALFISGPSKTADIEQTLVIGAHGAKRTTVVLVGS